MDRSIELDGEIACGRAHSSFFAMQSKTWSTELEPAAFAMRFRTTESRLALPVGDLRRSQPVRLLGGPLCLEKPAQSLPMRPLRADHLVLSRRPNRIAALSTQQSRDAHAAGCVPSRSKRRAPPGPGQPSRWTLLANFFGTANFTPIARALEGSTVAVIAHVNRTKRLFSNRYIVKT